MAEPIVSIICKNWGRKIKLWEFRPEWAKICAFGNSCIEWSAQSDPSSDEGDGWERLNTRPVQGKVYTLRVSKPFTASSNQPFWILYQPALSSLNGLGDPPEEIPLCCLIQASLLNVIEHIRRPGEDYAWITINVQEAIPLGEIAQRFAPNHTGEACRMVQQNLSQGYEKVQYGEWTVISVSAQGNVGGWIVCQQRNGSQTIVLYCDWWVNEDDLYAGNRPLTEAEWHNLASSSVARK